MISKYKNLTLNTVFFIFAQFIPKLIVFLLVPLYTSKLSAEDYGYSDLLINTSALAVPIFTLCIADAVFRFVLDEKYNKYDVIRIGWKITILGGVLFSIICIVAWRFVGIDRCIFLAFLILYSVANAIYRLETYYCRGINSVKSITIGASVQALLSGGLSVVFLLVLNTGIIGYLGSITISVVIGDIVVYIHSRLYTCFKSFRVTKLHESKYAKSMIVYSAPLIITTLGWWINSASDKYILLFFQGAASVGVYAVAYKIPAILNAFHSAIVGAFQISVITDTEDDDSDNFFSNSYAVIKGMSAIICSLIILFCLPLAMIMFSNGFFFAWKYVPILTIAAFAQQMADISLSSLFKYKKTILYACGTLAGALANTVLNFALIPKFGTYGAAIATLLGYLIMWIIGYMVLRKYMRFSISLKTSLMTYILLGIQTVIAIAGTQYVLLEVVMLILLIIVNRKTIEYLFVFAKRMIKRSHS